MGDFTFEARKQLYADLWASIEIRPSKAADIEATASKIISKKTRYRAVEKETGVPWVVIGLIHAMEAGCSFSGHLHNGDPLVRRTVQVPAGRPRTGEPPFQWKDSAIDAIRYDGLDKVDDWHIERICFELERFNGAGYVLHHADVNSPYLWSGSNHYARGKYVADGKWSSSAVSGQSGAMPILKAMMEMDKDIKPGVVTETDITEPTDIEEKVSAVAAFPKADGGAPIINVAYKSGTVWSQIIAAVSVIAGMLTDWAKNAWDWVMWAMGIVPAVYEDAKESLTSAQEMANWFGVSWGKISLTIAFACVVIAIIRHVNDKQKLVETQ